jgi:hypothetical protein
VANARLTMKTGSSGNDPGDDYTGLDRFGRLAETLWVADTETLVQTKYHDAFRIPEAAITHTNAGIISQYTCYSNLNAMEIPEFTWKDVP